MTRPAAFLDRDGTIVRDSGFLKDPEAVESLEGAPEAVRRLNDAGWPVVVVTNQSGIARGLLSEAEYAAVAARIDALLGARGARIDATYYCPHHPDLSGPCDCRKPGLGSHRAAAERLGIDLARSAYIGDRLTDLLPALPTGGRGILVLTGEGPAHRDEAARLGFEIVRDLASAVDLVLGTGARPGAVGTR